MIEFIAESDPLVAKVKPEMVINHTILKRLDDSGFHRTAVEAITEALVGGTTALQGAFQWRLPKS